MMGNERGMQQYRETEQQMNAAFRRGEAITRLESYSEVIVLHLTLVTLFPESRDVAHWDAELDAFRGLLRRYDKSKTKSGHNFSSEDVERALLEVLEGNRGKDYIIQDIMGVKKGMIIDYTQVDWSGVEKSISLFSKSLFQE
jgi:hypothetical protein